MASCSSSWPWRSSTRCSGWRSTGFKTNAELFGDAWGLPDDLALGELREGLGPRRRPLPRQQRDRDRRLDRPGHDPLRAWRPTRSSTRTESRCGATHPCCCLGGMMLAATVALDPAVPAAAGSLRIFDTYWALIVLYTAFRIPFTIFLIRAYMIDLPREMEDAAIVDGASRGRSSGWSSCRCADPIMCRRRSCRRCSPGTSSSSPSSSSTTATSRPCRSA